MAEDIEDLLADAGWIRALAGRLVRDGATADDLVQDTWVVALERPQPDALCFRRWGGAVLRNLARQRRRGNLRRDARERAAAQAEAEPSPRARLERLETHRLVVEAVRALEEPYRDAILARYFEGSSPAEIARRKGVPVRTVHSQLHRGRARLREQLERRLGGGEAWSFALLALAASPRRAFLPSILGALLVSTKLKLAALTVAVLGVGGAAYWMLDPSAVRPAEPTALAPAPATIEDLRAPERPAVAVRRAAQREEGPPPPAAPSTATEEAPVPATPGALRGRVIDATGRAVAGVRVSLRTHGGRKVAHVETDGEGRYEILTEDPQGILEADDEEWITLLQGMVWAGLGTDEDRVLVVARPRRLAGQVVGPSGVPVDDASVELVLPPDFRSGLGEVLMHAREPRWRASVDELGRFDLLAAPDVEGCLLFAERGGFRNRSIQPPRGDAYGLELVLSAGVEDDIVRGTVVDAAGEPVEGAYVGLHFSAARTLSDGSFTIREPDQGAQVLWAAKAGLLPASARRLDGSDGEPGPWPDPLVLVLAGEPFAIEGRVVDERGEPVPNVEVWTDDRTPFGAVADEQFGANMTMGADVENLLAGRLHHERLLTDSEGRFALPGLLERDYRLTVLHRESLRSTTTAPLPAGCRGVRIVLPTLESLPPIAGRVLGLDGSPLPRLHVEPWLELDEHGFPSISGKAAVTDENGAFVLRDLAVVPSGLRIGGPDVGLGVLETLSPADDLAHLEYRLPRCVSFRLALSSDEADHAELRGADDAVLSVVASRGNLAFETTRFALDAGRTEAMTADERATTLVLFAGDRELRRVPVRFVVGELNVVDG